MVKRLVSGSLAFCLGALVVLSSPIQVRADAQDLLNILAATPSNALPVQIGEIPVLPDTLAPPDQELEDDDLEEIVGAGANAIADFDPDSLVPLTPEQIEYLNQAHDDEPETFLDTYSENDVSAHSAIAISAGAAALLLFLWKVGSSALNLKSADRLFSKIESMSTMSYATSIKYFIDNKKRDVLLKSTMAKSLLDKLNDSATDTGYSVTLTDDDKNILIGALRGSGFYGVTDLDMSNVNVKAIDGYKYYYYVVDGLASSYNYVKVLYTSQTVAFAVWAVKGVSSYGPSYTDSGTLRLYSYIAPAVNDPFQEMDYYVALNELSDTTGFYEFYSGTAYTTSSSSSFWRVSVSCLPFTVIDDLSATALARFKENYLAKSVYMLDDVFKSKMVTVKDIMALDTIAGGSDLTVYTTDEKNMYGLVTGVNSGAGTVTGTGTTTKPGTETGTGTGTGSGTTTGTTTVDMSGVISELKTMQGVVSTMQSNVSAMSGTMTSVLAELQEIKLSLKDIAAVAGTKVDMSPVVDVIEDVQADVIDIRDIIEVLRADVAYQQELITDIKTNVAAVPNLIDDVRAEVAAVPDLIDDVRTDIGTLTDALLDVYPALDSVSGTITDTGTKVGTKVDALPAAITDTMADAITTDMTKAQTSNDWAMTSPLYDRFPFSIPWDVAGCFSLLVADPIKPIWRIPFKVDLEFYKIPEQEIVIDLSGDEWVGPVKVVRAFILIAFIAGLAIITRGLIKG